MHQPLQTQEQDQEQSVQARLVSDDRPFHVPATPFQVCKSRFYPHSATILLHTAVSSWPIREQDPRFPLLRVPDRTDRGGQTAIVPDQC